MLRKELNKMTSCGLLGSLISLRWQCTTKRTQKVYQIYGRTLRFHVIFIRIISLIHHTHKITLVKNREDGTYM